jgi:hypothetical protein
LQYVGIFLAGSTEDDFNNPSPVTPPAPQVLIDYVKAGGNIYIASGTDPDLPQAETQQWNQVLNACGLQLNAALNNINQIVPINSLNPLFEGVHGLFQQNGTSISKLSSTNPGASVLVSSQGQGLYADCSFDPQIVNDLVNFVALKPFKTTQPSDLCPSPNFAGAFDFDAMLTGKEGIPAIMGLKAQVTAITDGNIVENSDLEEASREGATITFPPTDDFDDGVLTAGQSVRLHFRICLQQIKPFFLTVDVLGRIPGTGVVHNVSNVEELINAINMANDEFAFKGRDTIDMAAGTYTLSTSLPPIESEIILNGNGSIIERSSAAGTPDFRIFLVQASGNLSLKDLAVRNGNSSSSGAGIHNRGTLTMRSTTVSDNTCCQAGIGGEGGGGIYNRGTLTMHNSTVSGNKAYVGGGIFNDLGSLRMSSSTVSGNNATFSDFKFAAGGGILNYKAAMTMTNSIVADQAAGGNSNCGRIEGGNPITSLGYNLDSDGTCYLTETADKPRNSNAKLGPLQNNGGLTQTHALLSGSDAIDAGDPTGCKDADGNLLTTDQRGFIRAVDGGSGSARCDMGAYEFNSTLP